MANMTRKRTHLPQIETLEDRFLPTATSVLPLSKEVNQACTTDIDAHSSDLNKDDKAVITTSSSTINQVEQGRVTDAAFDPGRSNLFEMLYYKPMFAVMTYQPSTMQYHETIWLTFVSYKPTVNSLKPKPLTSSLLSPEGDDMVSVIRNVAAQTVSASLAATVRLKDTSVGIVAKDLVDAVVPISTNRATETTATVNLTLANATVGSGLSVLPNYLSSPARALEVQGNAAQRTDGSTVDNQETLPPQASRGATAVPDNEILVSPGRLMTEKLGLHTDESSLIVNEIEQALQTLVEPFAANLQSYEPSVLWVFLSSWVAAAGITYEYLRRKSLVHQLGLDVMKDWLPQHFES